MQMWMGFFLSIFQPHDTWMLEKKRGVLRSFTLFCLPCYNLHKQVTVTRSAKVTVAYLMRRIV